MAFDEVIILAGGRGERLKSVVPDRPKPLALVGTTPFLDILIQRLSRAGCKKVILSLGYQASSFYENFKNKCFDISIEMITEPQPLGTGGAVCNALKNCKTECVLVLNGDTFLDLDLPDLKKEWLKKPRNMLIARTVDKNDRYSSIEVRGGLLQSFSKECHGKACLINAGAYIFSPQLTEHMPRNVAFSLEEDFLSYIHRKIEISVYHSSGFFLDIGTPEDYERAQHVLPPRLEGASHSFRALNQSKTDKKA